MNRFRSRKKSDGDSSTATSRNNSRSTSRRASIDDGDVPPLPSLPSFASKTFRRKKQASPPPKPEVDLTTALPPSDDFRTSLLMPNLSARFSMLREQDDPASKIGKANDDSVLFPKRASRLDLFNRQGLSDIAEVDSLRGSIRPPFASARADSYGSGYETDEGSIMSRAKPGEGNTMFGGRQKIYKIPVGGAGSVKNFNGEEGDLPAGVNMGGKALYEEDTAPSAFQRLREQERQERERAGLDHSRSSHDQDRSGSPPLAKYNRNRETSSSTNSGPSQPRTSTAATSVASQRSAYETINGTNTQPSSAGSDRTGPKVRRMYGQGLDQHMYEQQSSALHRLASLQGQRAGSSGTPRDLIASRRLSRSASNLQDRYQRQGPLIASNNFRSASPAPSNTPPKMQHFDLGFNEDHTSNIHADSGYGRSPPISPPMSPTANGSDPLVASLEPNDLGKATASGAFNKPKVKYSEQQYLQRQLQLQEGRGTPSPQLVRPFSPQAFTNDEHKIVRSRNNSQGSQFSRTNSIRQPWEHHMEDRVLRPVHERGSGTNSPMTRESDDRNDRSFFAGISGSEVGSQRDSESEPNSPNPSAAKSHGLSQPRPQPPQPKPVKVNQKPNFNPNPSQNLNANYLPTPAEESVSDSRSYRSEETITQQPNPPGPEDNNAANMETDSPTLGPVGSTNGLSGLVREHLRQKSDQSSIYSEVRQSIFGHESALQSHSRNQSYDEAEADREYWRKQSRESDQSSVVAPPPLSFAARHILEQATALRNNQENYKAQEILGGNDKAQRVLGGEAPRPSHARNTSTSWQEELKSHHSRGASSETQHEREALAEELAERRRRVQLNLKSYAESGRSASPGPGAESHDNSPPKNRPFGILKKSSKTSLADNQPQQQQQRPSKAMKMLGIDSEYRAGPQPNQNQPPAELFVGRDQFSDRAMPPRQQFPPKPLVQARRPQDVRQHSDTPPSSFSRPREQAGTFRSQENLNHSRHSPRSSKSGSSYSDKSDRRSPESRNGSNANGFMKSSMDQGRVNGYSPNGVAAETLPENQTQTISPPRPTNELMASITRHGAPPPSERSPSAMSGRMRSRSNSRTTAPGYPESRVAPSNVPFMINPAGRPAPSPTPFHTTHSASSLHDSRPNYSHLTTPTMINPQPHSAPSSSHGHSRTSGGRKRSINKHEISEPTFISCTSSVDTVNLPPEASLRNGMDFPPPSSPNKPPIPARDSRRKRTQTLLQALGRIEKPQNPAKDYYPPSPYDEEALAEERSPFSATDDEKISERQTMRQLRKISNERVPQQALHSQSQSNVASPVKPSFSVGAREMHSPPSQPQGAMEGHLLGHVPYQARQDVPASAVMF
ncbi:hypothetical protein MMC21_005429 [Puttea exsequens]|nr:hypothetical protein [Puttea exsequens]